MFARFKTFAQFRRWTLTGGRTSFCPHIEADEEDPAFFTHSNR